MNSVLFPSAGVKDFAGAIGEIGWVPIDDTESLLTMAEAIAVKKDEDKDSKDDNSKKKKSKDHAIPSPIAHLKDFYKKFLGDEKDAVNEWRGMLAVIAFQKSKAFDITIKEIPVITNKKSATSLGKVMGKELYANPEISGYTKNDKGESEYSYLSVFCKDGKPFAMFMPSIGICPFKQYDRELFSGVSWYNDNKGEWTDIKKYISHGADLTMEEKKLYSWLKNLKNGQAKKDRPGLNTALTKYMDDILRDPGDGKRLRDEPQVTNTIDPIPGEYSNGAEVWEELKRVCPLPEGAPKVAFSDKMLFIVPNNKFSDSAFPQESATCFTPRKGIFWDNSDSVFVVPPISVDAVKSIRKGSAKLIKWDVNQDGDNVKVEFTLSFAGGGGEQLTYIRKFTDRDVAWVSNMPYLSLWPFVNFDNDSWKEHYLAIFDDGKFNKRSLDGYNTLTKTGTNCKRVSGGEDNNLPVIKISVTPKSQQGTTDTYDCVSAYKDQKFRLISSTSEPFSIDFSYTADGVTYTIGSWIISREGAATPPSSGKAYIVSMDFGTTSTNIFLMPKGSTTVGSARSISSPGKYLCELYNPYKTINDPEGKKTQFYQNYYLFSGDKGHLGKIFTYGQNFTTTKNNQNCGEIISNASGRMIKVDNRYILSRGPQVDDDGNVIDVDDINDGDIKCGLKMNDDNDPDLIRATNNFIENALTYAVLEAKALGATSVDLRISYPSETFGNTALGVVDKTRARLQEKSGVTIECGGATEARSAGEYFANKGSNGPVPEDGFVIVDIGGGTTDVSFWREDAAAGDTRAEMKTEHSFGYAGNYLVTKTIIQAFRGNKDIFANMWSVAAGTDSAKAIERYNCMPLKYPIENTRTKEYRDKSSTLDYILENCALNTGMLSRDDYERFLSAIRIKYYALFTLIATFIVRKQKAGEITLGDTKLDVCLAGCGSKGLNFCTAGSKGADFETNLAKMFNGKLKKRFSLTKPTEDDKREVVEGLCYLSSGHLTRFGDDGVNIPSDDDDVNVYDDDFGAEPQQPQEKTAPESEPAAIPVQNPITLQEGKQAYMKLCFQLSQMEGNLKNNHILSVIGANYDKARGLFYMTNPQAERYLEDSFGNVRATLNKSNYDPATRDENFALLMLEQMINQFI